MSELKLYEISEEYVSYISTVEKKVFSSKENDRNHTRKRYCTAAAVVAEFIDLPPYNGIKS